MPVHTRSASASAIEKLQYIFKSYNYFNFLYNRRLKCVDQCMYRNSLYRTLEAQLIIIITISCLIAVINADLQNFAENRLTPETLKNKISFWVFLP